jgi:two-component system, NtrC family, sensor kinase
MSGPQVRRHKKSLRSLLMVWLILFSVVPLAFLTGYSLVKYEQAIDQELGQRLQANFREVQVILSEYEAELARKNKAHSQDKKLGFFLSTSQIDNARQLVTTWLNDHFASEISVFSDDGRLEVALSRGPNGRVERFRKLEGRDVYLSDRFIKKSQGQTDSTMIDFSKTGSLELISIARVQNSKGQLAGFIEEVVRIDPAFLLSLKNRLGLEIIFFDKLGEAVVSSHEDLAQYRKNFFLDQHQKFGDGLFELNIRSVPFGFLIQPVSWGEDDFFVALGASKQASREVLKNVNVAFYSVVGTIVVLLILLSFFMSRILLRPLNQLVETLDEMDFGAGPVVVDVKSDNELGHLAASFNDMSGRVYRAQKALKENIVKLETANQENIEAQTKLVQAAKMAGLGQLVAGVAHELNNPISFIYSNMTHLREYSEKLIGLVRKADQKADLKKEKDEAEFDYITLDLPKLIRSCEDGARRTRDIVLGLRSFSRLEEAVVKEVDLHEGLDATLALLQGELKSQIKVVKKYGSIPKVMCYPSQLNQVFMNILANAVHAIDGEGTITISTMNVDGQRVCVAIRDTGRGMDAETQQKVFDPFFTTKGVAQGTGLGLSISYGIVQKHGGEILVQSELGRGTEFKVLLPVRSLGH